jgi:hypothetical protein
MKRLIFVIALALVCASCATTTAGGDKFDTCKAIAVSNNAHTLADGASGIVCNMLTGEKKANCLKHRATAKAAGKALIDIASAIAKACGI